ncbi:MAG: endonuclease [Elusimicrobia bacterium HGW-Elusimicrobia-1]|jgi:endonuclease-3 related protein|nr:MAG: endonuclease [Elusimicrobia bacterium HGW-Elusimicrobia-1]
MKPRGKSVYRIYKTLLAAYGWQGWWPVTPPRGIFPGYKTLVRLSSKQSLEVAIGAILTQNTSWTNVERAVVNLNRAGFFRRPFDFSVGRIRTMIRPAGHYNQKAAYVRNFLGAIKKYFGGKTENMSKISVAELRERLLEINGIGRETADSIILYAARKPVFVVDAYTLRIASRAGLIAGKTDYEMARHFFELHLPRSAKIFAEYHALLVRHAKEYCGKNNPACKAGCPLLVGGLCSWNGWVG